MINRISAAQLENELFIKRIKLGFRQRALCLAWLYLLFPLVSYIGYSSIMYIDSFSDGYGYI